MAWSHSQFWKNWIRNSFLDEKTITNHEKIRDNSKFVVSELVVRSGGHETCFFFLLLLLEKVRILTTLGEFEAHLFLLLGGPAIRLNGLTSAIRLKGFIFSPLFTWTIVFSVWGNGRNTSGKSCQSACADLFTETAPSSVFSFNGRNNGFVLVCHSAWADLFSLPNGTIKVSYIQIEFMRSSFLPKCKPKITRIPALPYKQES